MACVEQESCLNSVLCTACGVSTHDARIRRSQFTWLKILFEKRVVNKLKKPVERPCDGVETVTKFSYLGDRLNATGGCETAVTTETRIGRSSGNAVKYSTAKGFD